MGQGCPQEYLLQETKGTRSEDLPPVPSRRAVPISTVYPALDARIFYREALALRDHGYDVTVFGVCKEDARVEGVSVRAIGGSHGRFDRMAMSGYRGLRAVLAERGDVYHFHDPELLPVALADKWLLRWRVVYDAHEDVTLITLKDWIPGWLKRPMVWLVGAVDRLAARYADADRDKADEVRYRGHLRPERVLGLAQRPNDLGLEEQPDEDRHAVFAVVGRRVDDDPAAADFGNEVQAGADRVVQRKLR